MSENRFCDFCDCEDCRTGFMHDSKTGRVVGAMTHALTADGLHICDVCYNYDACTKTRSSPCEEKGCAHRPKIVGQWKVIDETARMEYQDAFTRYMAASDRERDRENRLAQAAAERRAMEIAKSNQRAAWAMVFFTIVIAVATAWQACHH